MLASYNMKIGICVFAVVAFFQLCCAKKIDLTGKCRHSDVDGKRIKETVKSQPEHFCVYAKFTNGTELFSCEIADWLHDPKEVLPDFPVNECVSGPGFEAFLKCDCPGCNNDPCTVGETRCGKPTITPTTTTTLSISSKSDVLSTTADPTTTATSAIITEQSVTPITQRKRTLIFESLNCFVPPV